MKTISGNCCDLHHNWDKELELFNLEQDYRVIPINFQNPCQLQVKLSKVRTSMQPTVITPLHQETQGLWTGLFELICI
jgi:hypothetical protein